MAQRKKLEDEALQARVRVGRWLQVRRQSLIVPWKQFAATLAEYVEWFSFCLWARTTFEADGHLSTGLDCALQERVPGFLEQAQSRRIRGQRAAVCFWLRLLDWVHSDHFIVPQQQGWLDALRWYAASDPLVRKAWFLWHQQDDQRKARKPLTAPSYAEWREALVDCPEFVEPGSLRAKALGLVAGVEPRRFRLAVEDYVGACAFVFWVRAIESATEAVPAFVQKAVHSRWPDCDVPPDSSEDAEFWRQLLAWVERHFFSNAISEGWLSALRFIAEEDLHYQRLLAYCLHCEERWIERPLPRYPRFAQWASKAENYIEPAATE
ncbi:MAG: hypothetical protein ABSH05_26510 [Bryobacteraceae bacterium]|jgi:hypothetical protein